MQFKSLNMQMIDVSQRVPCLLTRSYLQRVGGLASVEFGVCQIVSFAQSLKAIQIESPISDSIPRQVRSQKTLQI